VETDAFDPRPPAGQADSLRAIRHVEKAIMEAEGIEGIALRYGNFYGPAPGSRWTATSLLRCASAASRRRSYREGFADGLAETPVAREDAVPPD
jgi:hypothetical protein